MCVTHTLGDERIQVAKCLGRVEIPHRSSKSKDSAQHWAQEDELLVGALCNLAGNEKVLPSSDGSVIWSIPYVEHKSVKQIKHRQPETWTAD